MKWNCVWIHLFFMCRILCNVIRRIINNISFTSTFKGVWLAEWLNAIHVGFFFIRLFIYQTTFCWEVVIAVAATVKNSNSNRKKGHAVCVNKLLRRVYLMSTHSACEQCACLFNYSRHSIYHFSTKFSLPLEIVCLFVFIHIFMYDKMFCWNSRWQRWWRWQY